MLNIYKGLFAQDLEYIFVKDLLKKRSLKKSLRTKVRLIPLEGKVCHVTGTSSTYCKYTYSGDSKNEYGTPRLQHPNLNLTLSYLNKILV